MSEADGLRQRRPLRPQVVTDDGQAPEAKDGSSFSGRVFRVTFLMLAVSLTVPLLGAMLLLESPIDPQPLSFKEPPLLLGVLQPNTKLQQAERLFENQLIGPESIANIGETRDDEPACGRPLGIRAGPNGTLFVADAYKGLFEVNPWKREVKLLISSETPIEGRKMSFVNDLTITQDGRKIYFTDSSSKWQRRDYLLLVMEGTDDGRLLEYDTETKEVKVLLDQLRFPNGVQLSPTEDFVLVAETTMARIRRFYLSGLMKGGADLFVENLPGFPDNIRPSSSGGYWVGMATIRSNPGFSMLDFLSERPYIKRMIFKIPRMSAVCGHFPHHTATARALASTLGLLPPPGHVRRLHFSSRALMLIPSCPQVNTLLTLPGLCQPVPGPAWAPIPHSVPLPDPQCGLSLTLLGLTRGLGHCSSSLCTHLPCWALQAAP
ncbi:adipocyte plasma membrane-associated protein isoform X2 [Meles meles]|uniref:adipocyte plasma membrane-associated protein isoform X2 n=1 Tax=Meles meles TaxID=9662 RepID=UPI001E6A0A8E|nr:adipocyte plasma membrane-associated protein isoform X2 [Meles meles]